MANRRHLAGQLFLHAAETTGLPERCLEGYREALQHSNLLSCASPIWTKLLDLTLSLDLTGLSLPCLCSLRCDISVLIVSVLATGTLVWEEIGHGDGDWSQILY